MAVKWRPLRSETDDLEHVWRWLNDPAVAAWYQEAGGRPSRAYVREKYGPRSVPGAPVQAYMLEVDGTPAGYGQVYWVQDAEADVYGVPATGRPAGGLDLFLGGSGWMGRGLGLVAVVGLLACLRARGARLAVIDPDADNVRALATYRRAGFVSVRRLPAYSRRDGMARDGEVMARDLD